MKKIVSVILSLVFLNFMFYPAVMAEAALQPANEEQIISDRDSVTNYAEQVQQAADTMVQTQNVSETTAQRAELTDDSAQSQPESTVQPYTERTEHLAIKKKKSKAINVESVYVSSHGVEIPSQDILQVAFINDFNGKKANIGDTIEFRFPNDIVTQEGTMIIPSTARIIAEITDLKQPKPLHLSGKVYLNFKYIEVNGTRKPLEARLYNKKDFLSRKTMNETAAVGETAVATGAGAAAGMAITAATATDAAVLVFGTALATGVGAIVGVAVGILLPGANFKAKAGQRVTIQLTNELDI